MKDPKNFTENLIGIKMITVFMGMQMQLTIYHRYGLTATYLTMTISVHGNTFYKTGRLSGEPPTTDEFHLQKPMIRSIIWH